MNESTVVGCALVLAILTAGTVAVVTGSYATALGATPIGVAIYLAIGVGAPQLFVASAHESSLRLGLGVLATVGAVASLLAGIATNGLTAKWGVGVVTILLIVVAGVLLAAVARAFHAGFQATR